MRKFIIIKNLKIEEANALSSPYTVGFPAMPAWLGFMHRIQRELKIKFDDLSINNIGIICNEFESRLYRSSRFERFSVIDKRHPILKDGKTDSFIEDPLCNLNVSLILEFTGVKKFLEDEFIISIEKLLNSKLKVAGGNIINYRKIFLQRIDESDEMSTKRLLRSLNTGFSIINRNDLIKNEMIENNVNAFDAIISYLENKSTAKKNEDNIISWESQKKKNGWLVPISVGFQGISELDLIDQQRDCDTLHRFAEAIVTLGEFIMPYRLNNIDEMLWHYEYDNENCLYITK